MNAALPDTYQINIRYQSTMRTYSAILKHTGDYYAVYRGWKNKVVLTCWSDTKKLTNRFRNAIHKKFPNNELNKAIYFAIYGRVSKTNIVCLMEDDWDDVLSMCNLDPSSQRQVISKPPPSSANKQVVVIDTGL